jgi:hypothetical protein
LELEIGSGVFPDWRGVGFWRRPEPDQPDFQMFEYSPHHLAVIYTH